MAVVLNPQCFIIGGGVSKAGDILFEQIREVFEKYTQEIAQEGVEIVAATLGNNAGVVGAAGLILAFNRRYGCRLLTTESETSINGCSGAREE